MTDERDREGRIEAAIRQSERARIGAYVRECRESRNVVQVFDVLADLIEKGDHWREAHTRPKPDRRKQTIELSQQLIDGIMTLLEDDLDVGAKGHAAARQRLQEYLEGVAGAAPTV